MKILWLILLFPLAGLGAPPPLRTPVEELVYWETRGNGVVTKSETAVDLEHFEIPLDLLTKDVADFHDPKITEEMVFERDGRKFLRWVVNPEDSKYAKQIEGWLKKKGESAARHKYFKGYRTASPSILITAPNGAVFSVKGPTTHNGGQDMGEAKRLRARHAKIARGIADFVDKHFGSGQTFAMIPESAGFGIDEIDLGLTVRDYSPMVKEGTYWVPAFSFVSKESTQLAERLGVPPETALLDYVMKPYAKACAELLRETGLTIHNPHAQNFLMEMKPDPCDPSKLMPTGRIRLRDLQDLHIYKPFFENLPNGYGALADFSKRIDEFATMRIGLSATNAASWYDANAMQRLYNEFDREAARQLERVFGMPRGEFLKLAATNNGYLGRDVPYAWWNGPHMDQAIAGEPASAKIDAQLTALGEAPTFAQLEKLRAHDMIGWTRWRDLTVRMIAMAKDADELRRALALPSGKPTEPTASALREAIERRLAKATGPEIAVIHEALKQYPGYGSRDVGHRPLAALVAKVEARLPPPAPVAAKPEPAPVVKPVEQEARDHARGALLKAKNMRDYRAAVEAAEAQLGRPAAALLVELTLDVPLGFKGLTADDKTFFGVRLTTPGARARVGYTVDSAQAPQTTGGNRLTAAFKCLFKKLWK